MADGAAPVRVLVIEDEAIVAFDMRRRLTRLGYEIPAIASSGREALRALPNARPDVALVDINIEGDVDGIDTAAQIVERLGIPIIFVTAYSDERTLARARQTHPHGYLLKPFSERELHATIQMSLERHRTELALQRNEARLRLAMSAAELALWDIDIRANQISVFGNCGTLCRRGQRGFQLPLPVFLERIFESDRPAVAAQLSEVTAGGPTCHAEFRYIAPSGLRWLRVQGKSLSPAADSACRVIGVAQDVTERKRTEERHRLAATVFDAAHGAILIMDADWRVISANAGFCSIARCSISDIMGSRPKIETSEGQAFSFESTLNAGTLLPNWCGEIFLVSNDQRRIPMLMDLAAVADEHSLPLHHIAVFTDLTEIRHAEVRLQHLAHHDSLTDLPNRLLCLDRLEHAMARADRHALRGAVILLDLDYFKRVNDTLGHNTGDEVLCVVGDRLRNAVRAEDTVGRLGGDEFLVVLEQIETLDDAAKVAEKLGVSLAEPLVLESHDVPMSASIGIALFPDHGSTPEDVIRAADRAMYTAKARGRGRYAFYSPDIVH
jgi:diguanylate cyclase (GGDEF)-like protein